MPQAFDRVEEGYRGPLYAEISPAPSRCWCAKGSRLNELRLRHGSPGFSDTQLKRLHEEVGLVDGIADIEGGLALSVDLKGDSLTGQVGWRARRHAGVIDVNSVGNYDPARFLGPVLCQAGAAHRPRPGRVLHPGLARSRLHPARFRRGNGAVQPDRWASSVSVTPVLDPGFGHETGQGRGARAVLEVRSREVPFVLEHGQTIGRLVFERLTDTPPQVYGTALGSNYQRQGLKLSKHFRQP